MKEIMILSTASEIAEGLKMFLRDYQTPKVETSFESEKMTVGKASEYIGVSYATLLKWISRGKIRVHGNGRTRFVLKSELITDFKNSR
jgi:excisionase family DNA binding protein